MRKMSHARCPVTLLVIQVLNCIGLNDLKAISTWHASKHTSYIWIWLYSTWNHLQKTEGKWLTVNLYQYRCHMSLPSSHFDTCNFQVQCNLHKGTLPHRLLQMVVNNKLRFLVHTKFSMFDVCFTYGTSLSCPASITIARVRTQANSIDTSTLTNCCGCSRIHNNGRKHMSVYYFNQNYIKLALDQTLINLWSTE